MTSNAGRSSRDSPFRALRNLLNKTPTPDPITPSVSSSVNPTQSGLIAYEPPSSTMANLVRSMKDNKLGSKSRESDSWRKLVKSLQTLETGVNIFPPLNAALSELLACTTHIHIAEQNRREYDQLASDLADLVTKLQNHLPRARPERMPYSIENVARAIKEQAAHIKRQQDRSGITQAIRASDGELDIIGCYRRIEHVFRQLQADISLSIWDLAHEQWADTRLKDLNPVHDAEYNTALSMDMQRRGCTPNTRVKIMEEAIDWTRDSDTAKIYWMNGMAGTGKTTIAYSLCEQLEQSKQLGACFFCSRSLPACRNVNNIVPTIAYQLARFSNPYQNELCQALANKRDIAKREMSLQFSELIVKPLLRVKDAIPTDMIVVIDGLDECSGERDQELVYDRQGTQKILDLLLGHALALPIKFFVTSRPESGISQKLNASNGTQRFVLHDVEESFVQEDISTYLRYELRSIKADPKNIDRLAARAGRLFIFAATALRYIDPNDDSLDHSKRLGNILSTRSIPQGRAYRELDELYSGILERALMHAEGDEADIRRLVLHTVIGAREPLTISALTEIIGLPSEDSVQLALLPFQSVLRVSADTKVVSTLHASFLDFMLSAERSKELHCNPNKQNAYMTEQCFRIMEGSLKFNICSLETSFQRDQDVPDLDIRVKNAVSSELLYSCRYWGDHLYGASYSEQLRDMLDVFLRHRLLWWMEVLNMTDCIGSSAAILLQAFKFLPSDDSMNELRSMIQDSRNFATTYAASPASNSTPHIYISALPLVSQGFIREAYWPQMKGLVQIEGKAMEDRSNRPLAVWATGSEVASLALSNDGKRTVSGARNGTISVWDVSNGRRILGPLRKHDYYVWSVAFSPDGSRIASGSTDCTIRISNPDTGATLASPATSHTATICALSFSPDGNFLASASEDCTIRIWDAFSGAQIGTELQGHRACVMCVVFLSHGKHLVSCSDDHTIRVWDWRTGTTVSGPFEGHTDWVDRIALSPDDAYIASGSRDCTVRIWSIATGKTVVGPLEGHTDRVYSVAFSPDGKRVVSGSFDKTIRVWSSETGDLIAGPFQGHGGLVYSVLFSSDGTHIISGSEDGTICIWDSSHSIKGNDSELFGHTDGIMSIALSPDGSRLVSASWDRTICIWDTTTCNLILGPLTGHIKAVWSVVYNPDSSFIVSGSEDGTIRTWDAHTGSALASPLAQHSDSIMAVAVSPDGRQVVSGSKDGSVKIWDLHTGSEVASPPMHHTNWVRSVEFSPNGLYIASGSSDHSVCLWDVGTNSLIRNFEQHIQEVAFARFSPDSTKIVSCSWGGMLIVWDVDTSAVLSGPWKAHDDPVRAVAFSPDGTMIASGSHDRTIRLWDANNGTMIAAPFRGHTSWVFSLVFTPDGKHIISSSDDRTIRVWDTEIKDRTPHQKISNWVVDAEGWVRDSESRPVLWLPPDLKRITAVPPCSFVISHEGPIQINLTDIVYDDRWADCSIVASGSDTPGV